MIRGQFDTVVATMVAIMVLSVPWASAKAQTADGMTPAEEMVCDGEVGAAFGLCNAFCEAMDCDSDTPQASDNACDKVAANFAKHTGRDRLPCEVSLCPCDFSREAFNSLSPVLPLSCTVFDAFPPAFDSVLLKDDDAVTMGSGAEFRSILGPESVGEIPFRQRCEAVDPSLVERILDLTQEELVACAEDIVAVADASGAACPALPDFMF